jgi:hypothetical protein
MATGASPTSGKWASSPVDITLMTFMILQKWLPPGTRLTSTLRSPQDQLRIIQGLADKEKIMIRSPMLLDDSNTWLPVLKELRKRGYKVNAPAEGTRIPISPHTRANVVFDMSGPDLGKIVDACHAAERAGVVGFTQILPESKNNAVHVATRWIQKRAIEELHAELGFLYA